MTRQYTARYTTLEHGYMGQLVEWPEVVTEAGRWTTAAPNSGTPCTR